MTTRKKWIIVMACVLVVGIVVVQHVVMGKLVADFDDMRGHFVSIGLDPSYKQIREDQRDGKPPFFGDYPKISRMYIAPGSLDATCEQLHALATLHHGEYKKTGPFCSASFTVRAGLGAWLKGIDRYACNVSASALPERSSRVFAEEPTSAYTRVQADITDFGN
jgi:hypothetical protein